MSVQVLHSEKPTARKRHICNDCERTIQPGEQYRRQDNVYDDRRYSWKTCAHCQVLVDHIYRVDGGWYYDEGLVVSEWIEGNDVPGSPLLAHLYARWADITPDELRALLAEGFPNPNQQETK